MESKPSFYCYWVAGVAYLGAFLQSYVVCIIAGALFFIANEFHLTAFQQGNIASFILIGAMGGALSSGYLADKFGRRKSLILAAAIYFLTACGSLYLYSVTSFLILRFLKGFAVGITSIVVPMYLAEIAPSNKRGAFVSGYQLSLTLGTLVAYFVNLLFTSKGNWRVMFFAAAIPSALQLLCLPFFSESPKWLLIQGKTTQANNLLARLRVNKDTEETLKIPTSVKMGPQSLFSRPFLFLVFIGLILSFFQQLSGINAIIYFTPKILSDIGLQNPKHAICITLLIGIVNMVATLITMILIDRVGRKKLLLISQIGIISMLSILIFSLMTDIYLIDLLSIGSLIGYVFFYAIGLGPVVWVLLSEIFPLAIRAKALSLAIFVNWVCNYFIVLMFPYINELLGTIWTFTIFTVLSLGILPFFIFYIPETKGKTLSEIENMLIKKHTP